jgi:hypothetical protein
MTAAPKGTDCTLHFASLGVKLDEDLDRSRPDERNENPELRRPVTATRSGRLPASAAFAIHPRRLASCRPSKRAHQRAGSLRSSAGACVGPLLPRTPRLSAAKQGKVPWQCSRLAPSCLAHSRRAGPGRSMMMSPLHWMAHQTRTHRQADVQGSALRECEIQAQSGPDPSQQ